ncbi:MAG: ferredoxin [Candidatus Micrarchaeota archaeon]
MPEKKVPYVDPEICIGCSACSALCPAVYEMQPEGKSKVVAGGADSEENIQRSIDTCPVQAISWKEKK